MRNTQLNNSKNIRPNNINIQNSMTSFNRVPPNLSNNNGNLQMKISNQQIVGNPNYENNNMDYLPTGNPKQGIQTKTYIQNNNNMFHPKKINSYPENNLVFSDLNQNEISPNTFQNNAPSQNQIGKYVNKTIHTENKILINNSNVPNFHQNNLVPGNYFDKNNNGIQKNNLRDIEQNPSYYQNFNPKDQINRKQLPTNINFQATQNYNKIKDDIILCQDDLKKNNQKEANKYCSFCNIFVCNQCVIDFHDNHIKDAKISVSEFIFKKDNEIIEITDKLNQSLKSNNFEKMKKGILEKSTMIISQQKNENINKIKNLIKNLEEMIILEQKSNTNLIKEVIDFSEKSILNKMKEFEKEGEDLKDKFDELSNFWASFNTKEKSDFIINGNLDELRNRYISYFKKCKEIENDYGGNFNLIEHNLQAILKDHSYLNKLDQFDAHFRDILPKIEANSSTKFNLDYYVPYDEDEESINNNYNLLKYNQSEKDGYKDKEKIEIVKEFISWNKNNHEYIIIPNGREIIYYNLNDLQLNKIHLSNVKFIDKEITFNQFFDNCKHVNTGSGIFVTGGSENSNPSNKCFEVKIKSINEVLIYSTSIMNYARERHNIIYISKAEMIVVCSGLNNKNTEILKMKNKNWDFWEKSHQMNKSRANATLACFNDRYICCIGGYEYIKKDANIAQSGGVYLNSCEILDLDGLKLGWIYSELQNDFKLCASGVINKSENKILLCGGYDGKTYKNEVSECVIEKNNNGIFKLKIQQQNNSTLPLPTLFLHNYFCRNENKFFIFDIYFNIILYDCTKNSFKKIN